MTTERIRADEEGRATPIWPSKEATDECYDRCAATLVQHVTEDLEREEKGVKGPKHGLVFATHNAESVKRVLGTLKEKKLLEKGNGGELVVDEKIPSRVMFGQLLGTFVFFIAGCSAVRELHS